MTFQEMLEAVGHLTLAECEALLDRKSDNDLESMAGLFEASMTDLSIHAREYLHVTIQNVHDHTD